MKILRLSTVCLLAAMVASCTSGGDSPPGEPSAGSGGLTAFELENGVGPIDEPVQLGSLDSTLMASGAALFETRCSGCHKMDERYVGPPLGGVVGRRTPAYVLNMMLAPDSMYQRHPEARALLAQYATQMPNLNLTESEARALLEYLRAQPADDTQ